MEQWRSQTHDVGRAQPGPSDCFNRILECFNRILDCSIRVYRSFGHRDGGATEADGGASAPLGPNVATPLLTLALKLM